MFRRHVSAILAAALLAGASGCATFGDDQDKEARQADYLYTTAKTSLQNGYYATAIENYQKLESSYPFSRYAQAALLESAYAHYKIDDNESATIMVERFIKNNPNHSHLDYAYYLKGLAYFHYGKSLLNKVVPRDRTTKDPRPLAKSFTAFQHLHGNFPGSRYRESAREHLVVLRNLLAVYEIRVADFYLRQGSYIAAVNRIRYMLEKYDGAQNTPDALYLMAEAYRRLGADDLARDTLRVLKHNYPDYLDDDLKKAGAPHLAKRGWLTRLGDLADNLLDKLRY